MKKPVKITLIAISSAAVLCAAALGISTGVYYSIASGEFSAPAGTMIYAQGEPVYSLSRLRTGLSISRENLGLICGGKLRMDPVSSILGQHSVTERTVLELYPGAGRTELIARTKALESDRSDEELMELYCSAAYFGNGIYGADNAASFYFGKKPDALSADEAEILAQICSSEKLKGMTKQQLAEEFPDAEFSAQEVRTPAGSYYAQLLDELYGILDDLGYPAEEQTDLIYGGGLIVNSTMDIEVQSVLDQQITDNPAMSHFQLAMQISDYSGAVLGCSGGASDGTTADRCTVPRSPGSSIKPLSVYSTAIEDGVTTWAGFLPDMPDAKNWPQNYDGKFEEEVMTSYALRQSKNTCAVYLEKVLGGDRCFDQLINLGFSTLIDSDKVPIGMGMGYLVYGVTPKDMAAAYQIFGNGGSYTPPHYINSIVGADGETLYSYSAEPVRVVSENTAWIMNRMLRSNVQMEDGLGRYASIDGIEVIGKTGTRDNISEVVTDQWFAGGTPDMCAALWIGSDDQNLLKSAGTYPSTSKVWSNVMSAITNKNPSFTPCGDTVSAEVCRVSGGIATPGCAETETGWFAPGTLPAECSLHN